MSVPQPAMPVPAIPPPAWLTSKHLLDVTVLIWCAKTRALAKYYEPILTNYSYRYVEEVIKHNERASKSEYKAPKRQTMEVHKAHAAKYPYLLLEVLICHRLKVPQFLQKDCANRDRDSHRVHMRDALQPLKEARLTKAERDFNRYPYQPRSELERLRSLTPVLPDELKKAHRQLDLTDYFQPKSQEITIWHAL